MNIYNTKRLYTASCIALLVTAMTFSVRANLIGELGEEFSLSPKQIGEVTSAAFWGFTLAMFVGGPLCDIIGIGKLYLLCFIGHCLGLVLTIYSTGYWSLFLSTLLVGIGNGFVESASYAMVSSMYRNQKTKKLNAWHIWFPAGIVIGGLLAYVITLLGWGWKVQIGIILLPMLIYGALFFHQSFPTSERVMLKISNSAMIRKCFNPLFIFMLCCMALTAVTELGTNQWIVELLGNIGVPSILLLVFINGLMVIGRMNAGYILNKISSRGLLLISSVFSFIGLIWLSYSHGYSSFLAAGVFAVGICLFWPTMIGFVSENLLETGPLGLSLMGGTGMLAVSLAMPYLGQLYGNEIENAKKAIELTGPLLKNSMQIEINAGTQTLRYVSILPGILIVAFTSLQFMKKWDIKHKGKVVIHSSTV